MSFFGLQIDMLNSPLTTRVQSPAPASENFYCNIYGVPKKPKSFKQWAEAAQQNTRELQEHGSTSPLVWVSELYPVPYFGVDAPKVLVHGKNIPPNAIVGGEERRQPLYIARTFYEVCIAYS